MTSDRSLSAQSSNLRNLRSVLVTGAHRTATTWVGKMLAASGEVSYISEPLNVLHRPGVLRVPVPYWYTYICADNEAIYLPALQETLHYHYHLWAEVSALRSRRDFLRMGRDAGNFFLAGLLRRRPLLKDPFAVFSLPWFIDRLGCQVVITVRHPAAFASSLKRLDWPFDFGHLLAQPLLMRDLLEPYRAQMENMLVTPEDVIGQASLLWCMIYQVVGHYLQQYSVLVVRHEDFSIDPSSGYRKLYQALGLHFTTKVQETILKSSSADNPQELSRKAVHGTQLNSRANLHNWKRRLATEEIHRVRQLTEQVAAQYYPDIAWD